MEKREISGFYIRKCHHMEIQLKISIHIPHKTLVILNTKYTSLVCMIVREYAHEAPTIFVLSYLCDGNGRKCEHASIMQLIPLSLRTDVCHGCMCMFVCVLRQKSVLFFFYSFFFISSSTSSFLSLYFYR